MGYRNNIFMHAIPIIKISNNTDNSKISLDTTLTPLPSQKVTSFYQLAYIIQEYVLCIYMCPNVHVKIHGFGLFLYINKMMQYIVTAACLFCGTASTFHINMWFLCILISCCVCISYHRHCIVNNVGFLCVCVCVVTASHVWVGHLRPASEINSLRFSGIVLTYEDQLELFHVSAAAATLTGQLPEGKAHSWDGPHLASTLLLRDWATLLSCMGFRVRLAAPCFHHSLDMCL